MIHIGRRMLLGGALAAPALAAPRAFAQGTQISIATGTTGGVYYPLGGGLANILNRAIPGMAATVEVTGGSVANLQLLGANRVAMVMAQGDAVVDAVAGRDKFQGRPVPVRSIFVMYTNRMQVVTTGPAVGVANAVRRTIQEFDDNLPVLNARPVGEFMDRMVSREKTVALLSAVFGAVALLLACIGLYGVLSFGVARRTSEIGIRMALGAAKGEVIRMVLADTGRMVALGLAGGVIAAAALTRTVSSMLFGVAPLDPGTLAAAAALLVAVAALAALAPAHRASRVDPVTALRAE